MKKQFMFYSDGSDLNSPKNSTIEQWLNGEVFGEVDWKELNIRTRDGANVFINGELFTLATGWLLISNVNIKSFRIPAKSFDGTDTFFDIIVETAA